jgi:glutathione S-transferase
MLKLYGVPLSQPFRSVAWTLLQQKLDFEIILTVPGMKNKMGTLHESFKMKSRGRSSTVPLLEDGNISISESPAILSYVCERYGFTDTWYGTPGSARKATIDSYMHWHHGGTRKLAKLQVAQLRPDLQYTITEEEVKDVESVLNVIEDGWLQDDAYVAGNDVSIADMLAYEEFAQVYMTGLLPQMGDYPRIAAWVERMKLLPHHDEAHHALTVLGNLKNGNGDIPISKRLAAATKSSMQIFQELQAKSAAGKI